ncbi:MAG TPA: hypothetical protein VN577_21040 [Terriglobales bacterium]|nr:hypothetical protein [Terriglobales bacterium]
MSYELFGRHGANVCETGVAYVAAFPRQNKTGPFLASDNGHLLVAGGTWFHRDGYSSGSEAKLLSRYFEVGAEVLAKEVDGFYTIVIVDGRTAEATVLTDLGTFHVFERRLKVGATEVLALSTSSLLLAALGNAQLNTTSAQELVFSNCIYENRTLFRDVLKLPGLSVVRLRPGKELDAKQYWSVANIKPDSLDGDAAVDAIWHSVLNSTRTILRAFPAPVCDLTGGYDSRTVTAAMHALGAPVRTVVAGPEDHPDVQVAKGLSFRVGVPLVHVPPRQMGFEEAEQTVPLSDGEYDAFEMAWVRHVHETVASPNGIGVHGSFGEFPRGYSWNPLFPRTGAYSALDSAKLARMRYVPISSQPIFRADYRLDFQSHFTEMIDRSNVGMEHQPNTIQHDHSYIALRGGRWQGRIASSTNRLWPVISPFLFRDVVETSFRIRTPMRRRSLVIRKMFARYAPQFGRFPLEYGYPALPVNWKTAHLFWPIAPYFGKYYGTRIIARAKSSLGIAKRGAAVSSTRTEPLPAQQEFALERVRATGILDDAGIERLLCESRDGNGTLLFRRLLTLELTLGRLQKAEGALLALQGSVSNKSIKRAGI